MLTLLLTLATVMATPWTEPPTLLAEQSSGAISLEVASFEVGDSVTLEIRYQVGVAGFEVGDSLMIPDPLFHGIRFSKWGVPTTDKQRCGSESEAGAPFSLTTVEVSSAESAEVALERSTEVAAIHQYASSEIYLNAGSLVEGDQIVLRFGDTRLDPDCAHQLPPRRFGRIEWPAFERVGEQELYAELGPVFLEVLPKEAAVKLHAVAPSLISSSEEFAIKLSVLDELGNGLEQWEQEVLIQAPGGDIVLDPTSTLPYIAHLAIDQAGVYRLEVASGGLTATTNPIEVVEGDVTPIFWGDIHSHHGNSYVDDDGYLINENYQYARDVALLDISSESMKLPPHEIESEWLWTRLQDSCLAYSVDGEFLTLLGFEWMGGDDGHHNLYFDACEQEIPEAADIVDLAGESGLYAWTETLADMSAVIVPHASRFTGHNWHDWNNETRTLVEIYSEWGDSMTPASDPASIPGALIQGNRFGFIAGSDNHDGWMGNTAASRERDGGSTGGLAAFVMSDLSQTSIITAMRERATYATSGERIILHFEADITDQATFKLSAYGSDTIVDARIIAATVGVDDVQTLASFVPDALDFETSTTHTLAPNAEMAVWAEVTQHNGGKAWSSPLFIETGGSEGCGCVVSSLHPSLALIVLATAGIRRRRSSSSLDRCNKR